MEERSFTGLARNRKMSELKPVDYITFQYKLLKWRCLLKSVTYLGIKTRLPHIYSTLYKFVIQSYEYSHNKSFVVIVKLSAKMHSSGVPVHKNYSM